MLTRIMAVTIKELQQLSRDKLTFGMIVGIPLMQMLLFGYAINFDVRGLRAAFVDQAGTSGSRALLADLEASGVVRFLAPSADVANLQRRMNAGEINVGVIVPRDFERRRLERDRAAVQLLVDGSEPMTDGVAKALADAPLPARSGIYASRVATFEVRTEYNPERRTAVQIVPALIGVILNMTMVIFTAAAIVRERERGNFELLITTPVRSWELMAGKLIPYVFIGLLQTTLVLVAGSLLFDVPVNGRLPDLYMAAALFIAATLTLGLLISTVTRTQFQAFQLAFVTMLPSILLSGFMFPFDGMPKAHPVVRADTAAHAFCRDDPRHRAARRADHGSAACRPRSSQCSWSWHSRSPRCVSASVWTDGWQGWQAATPARTRDERSVTRQFAAGVARHALPSPMHARACSSSARCPARRRSPRGSTTRSRRTRSGA